jgi:mRNA-degrading endonuclease RelE of RelBE toxin-antitoxin system
LPGRQAVYLAAAREVARALPPDVKRRVRAEIDALKVDPSRGEPLHGDLAGLLRARVGRYRVVYRLTPDAIQIWAIGPRSTIYVDLERIRRSR